MKQRTGGGEDGGYGLSSWLRGQPETEDTFARTSPPSPPMALRPKILALGRLHFGNLGALSIVV
jgi:hypothetical protein